MKVVFIILASLSLVSIFVMGQTTKPSQTKKTQKTKPKITPTPLKKSSTPKPNSTLINKSTKTPTPVPTLDYVKLLTFEKEILAELNLFRASPQKYARFVEGFLKTYNGTHFINDEGVELISVEGRTPIIELIEILKQTEPLPEFKTAEGMVKAASDHTRDLVRNNKTGHRGTDGSLPDERVSKYGIAKGGVSENISYGANTARDVVLTMLIDDGIPSRNHRKNLLNPNLVVVGLGTGEIKQAGLTCVLVLTDSFIVTGKPK
jgi:uncharacterized protein YkwD